MTHCGFQVFEHAVIQHLDLVFHRLQLVAAKLQQGGAALVTSQQLVQRQLARTPGCATKLFQFGHAPSS